MGGPCLPVFTSLCVCVGGGGGVCGEEWGDTPITFLQSANEASKVLEQEFADCKCMVFLSTAYYSIEIPQSCLLYTVVFTL